jgi:hypothetical protein
MKTCGAWLFVTLAIVLGGEVATSSAASPQSGTVPGQESYRDVTIGRLERWLDAIERHKPGEVDGSFDEIRPWGPQEVDELLIDLSALLILMRDDGAKMFFRPSNGLRPSFPVFYTPPQVNRLRIRAREEKSRNDENRILKRGALLHTDIAAQLPFETRSPQEEPPARPQRLMVEIESTKDLSATFVHILEEFRHRYLVSFSPRGVPDEGWHRLEVRVKNRRVTIKARPGYFAASRAAAGQQ